MSSMWSSLIALTYGGVAAATVAALGAERYWLLELFTHFRVQYVTLALILLAVLASLRRWLWVVALLPLLALNVAPLLPHLGGAADAAPQSSATVKLATINLRSRNQDADRLFALLAAEVPDVVVLQELTPGWAQRIAPLSKRFPHQMLLPKNGVYGIGLLSVHPIVAERTVELAGPEDPAILATLRIGAAALTIIGAHLTPPSARALAARRNQQLAALVEVAGDAGRPLAILGDFNATPWSPYFQRLLDATGLVNAADGRGLYFTWPSFMPLLGIPIDHCLISRELTVIRQERGGSIGSDHYPLLTEVAL